MSHSVVAALTWCGHRAHQLARSDSSTRECAVDVGQGDAPATIHIEAEIAVGRLVVGDRAAHGRSNVSPGCRVVTPCAGEVETVAGCASVGHARVVVALADAPRLTEVERRKHVAGGSLRRSGITDHHGQ